MDIQGAGHDVLAGRVENLGPVRGGDQPGADGGDPLALDGDVGLLGAVGGDDGTVGDNQVVSHGVPPGAAGWDDADSCDRSDRRSSYLPSRVHTSGRAAVTPARTPAVAPSGRARF